MHKEPSNLNFIVLLSFQVIMQFKSGSHISQKEAKKLFCGQSLSFMAKPTAFSSVDFAMESWGEQYDKHNIKFHISDVLVFDTAEEIRFELKVSAIRDVIKGVKLAPVLKCLGLKTPSPYLRIQEQLVGELVERDIPVARLENPETERQRLKAYAVSVLQPGFDYFKKKFSEDLTHQVQLLKWARLCNPVRMCEIRPTAEQLDELHIFKCTSIAQPLVSLKDLKRELPTFLALALDLNAQEFKLGDILPFFQAHQSELPMWGRFACLNLLAAQQLNSAAAERVFSVLKQAFNETQEQSLGDYVIGVVMNRYNKRPLKFK